MTGLMEGAVIKVRRRRGVRFKTKRKDPPQTISPDEVATLSRF